MSQYPKQHPPALYVCFLTEMWERYGFYVVQTLLALFLVDAFHLSDTNTYALVGTFTAITYISPIGGGWIADHYLGQKNAVLSGAVVLFISYIILGLSSSFHGMLLALAGVAVGTGLLKPNVSSILGRQYRPGDSKRDSGFTIFYMGITAGIILGTTLPIIISKHYGWNASFISAALGLFLAFIVFRLGVKVYKIPEYTTIYDGILTNFLKAIVGVVILWGLFYLVLANTDFGNVFFIAVVILSVVFVLLMALKEKGIQRRKTLSFLLLCVISVMFWAFYFQMFMALTLFITRAVEPTVLGISFPAPYYVSVESLGMIVFGILLSKLWSKMKQKNVALVSGVKFVISMALMFLAYILIWFAMYHSYQKVGFALPWIILLAYLTISLSELMLSPVGLAAVTYLANPKVVSTMMGVFFVSLGTGGFLAGKLAAVASIHKHTKNLMQIKLDYFHAFSKLTTLTFIAFLITCVVCFFIWLLMRKRKA